MEQHVVVFIYLENMAAGSGLLVVPGSHKLRVPRPDGPHGAYGGDQAAVGSEVAPENRAVPPGCVNVAPVRAGDA